MQSFVYNENNLAQQSTLKADQTDNYFKFAAKKKKMPTSHNFELIFLLKDEGCVEINLNVSVVCPHRKLKLTTLGFQGDKRQSCLSEVERLYRNDIS